MTDIITLLEQACGGRCNAENNPCEYKEAALELEGLKPVAWVTFVESFCGYPKLKASDTQKEGYVPVYTAPPKRNWVGLHLDDIPETFVGDWSFLEGARWAEAKLKGKNT